jgi:RHS repeat-associated protein
MIDFSNVDRNESHRFIYPSIFLYFLLFVASFSILTHATHAQNNIHGVKHSVKPLDFSKPLSNEEIMAAGQLGGQLYPTHENGDRGKEKKVNLSFGEAIQEWNKHEYKKAVTLFYKHIKDHPDSPWVSEAMLHIGCDAQYTGHFLQAEANFAAIREMNKGKDHEGAKRLVNKATLRLAVLKVFQNNFKEAKDLFNTLKSESTDWRDRTYASHWIQRLSRYSSNDLAMQNCGNQALAYLLEKDGKIAEAREVLNLIPENLNGNSIKTLADVATQYGYPVSAIRATSSDIQGLPLPAIMHINTNKNENGGHFWILEKIEGSNLSLFDPQAGRRYEQSITNFSNEWSGFALVFSDKQFPVGMKLADAEMEGVFGGCCGVPRAEDNQGDPGSNKGEKSSGNDSPCGSPTWSINMVNMNFFIMDVPLWYSNPIGPSVEVSLSYNAQSAIATNEPFGNKWQFNYASYLVVDTGGQVTIFMPDGRRDIYSPNGGGGYDRPYKVFNTLTKISENHFELKFLGDTVYAYNIPSGTTSLQPFLVEIRDAYGQKLSFGYNSDVLLTTITDAMGRNTTLTYNSDDLVTRVADPFGRTASFEYDTHRNLTKITDMGGYWTSLTYDADAYVTSIQDSRSRWGFYIEPAGGYNSSDPYPPPGSPMWEDYRITVTNPLNGKEEYHYNGYSRYGWYVAPRDYIDYVDSSHNNFRSGVPKTQYTYTGISGNRGEISSISYPAGGNVSYAYNSNGNRTQITDAHAHATQFAYNSLGRVTSVIDPKTTVTNMTYDTNGIDLLQIQNGLGTVAMTYNDKHDIISITDRLGNTTIFSYNSYGQKNTQTDAKGIVSSFTYNANHQLQQAKLDTKTLDSFTYDAIGRVSTNTDATGFTLIYEYNNLNHVTAIIYSDGKSVTKTYSSCCPLLVDSTKDRSGRTTKYIYDDLKRLSETFNPEGGITKYGYDANGNVIKLIDPNSNVTSFENDLNNRLIKKTYADGKFTSFAYDAAGLLISLTNARGTSPTYAYDQNHNIMSTTYPDGTPTVTYEYDNFNRVTKRQDAIGTYLYSYDANSRMISIDGPWANDTLTYTYDVLGNRTGMMPEGGENVSYTYDSLSRLTELKIGSGAYSYSYSNASPIVQSLLRPNGSITSYQSDTLNRLTALSNKKSTSEIINQYVYGYNQQDVRATETTTNGVPITSFQQELVTYDYNKVNQLLSSTNPSRIFAHDNDGNMIQGYTPEGYVFTAAYDAENRLKSLEYTDNTGAVQRTEYLYSGDSFLAVMKKYVNGVLVDDTRFVRDGFLAVQDRGSTNNVLREYEWGLNMGGGIGGLLNFKQAGQNYSYLYDGKGNVTSLIDSSQSIAAAYTYDTFGGLMSKTSSLNQSVQFSTKNYDEKTGLSYYGFRFYSSSLGRWINRDPLGETEGNNLYSFVENNPVDFIDPNGEAVPLALIIIGVGGVIKGGFDAYSAYDGSHSLPCAAKAFGKGFVSGAIGTGVGLLTGMATMNPFITGASSGLASSVSGELLNGWNNNSAAKVMIATAEGLFTLPILGTKGRLPNLWTPRTMQDLGPNSIRLIGQEVVGDVFWTLYWK